MTNSDKGLICAIFGLIFGFIFGFILGVGTNDTFFKEQIIEKGFGVSILK